MTAISDRLKKACVYCVLDAAVAGYDRLFDILKYAAEAGVDIFQIRDKNGSDQEIIDFAGQSVAWLNGRAVFIVNDRPHAALQSKADGVHVGQDDSTPDAVRDILGPEKIIGVSCQTLAQARQAQNDHADYIGFGSVFTTQTKPDRQPMDLNLLAEVLREVTIPVFPIGGITAGRCALLKNYGVTRIAVTRAICQAKNVFEEVRALRKHFDYFM